MKIFLTNIPAFYKIRLYNEISKRERILVIFDGINEEYRNEDFFNGEMVFPYVFLKGNTWQKVSQLFGVLRNNRYDEFIIGGWENVVSLVAPFISKRIKNSCIIESSVYESTWTGLKGRIKKVYMHRISKVYASGSSQASLARNLGYMGEIKLTGGCGLLNYVTQPKYEERESVTNFIFVGRLVEVKNLKLLVNVFNALPDLHLDIVGFGEQEQELKEISKDNIRIVGAVDNKKLPHYYQKADVFILPSKSETWGLVVEEALNNGCPVIVSNRVGCRESIVTRNVGVVFEYDKPDSLKEAIDKIRKKDYYNTLRRHISELDFSARAKKQVEVYL